MSGAGPTDIADFQSDVSSIFAPLLSFSSVAFTAGGDLV